MGLFHRKKQEPAETPATKSEAAARPEPAPWAAVPNTFPCHHDAPLCPLLDDADLLFEFYETAGLRKELKKICKLYRWDGKPPVPYSMGPETLKPMVLSMLQSPAMRKRITAMDSGTGPSPALHQAIWTWFAVRNQKLAALVEKHTHEVKGRLFLKPEALAKLIETARAEGLADDPAPRQLACLAMAFAILQPDEASGLLETVAEAFPDLSRAIGL